MMHAARIKTLFLLTALGALCACGGSPSLVASNPTDATSSRRVLANVFDEYMDAEQTPAAGFDCPFGDADGQGAYTDAATGKRHEGWYKATAFNETYSLGLHPGEDWNGAGGANTDLGQPVHAVAHGRVVFAENCGRLWGNVVIVEHLFYENQRKRRIRSLYAHLGEILVRPGVEVRRRQQIATIGQD